MGRVVPRKKSTNMALEARVKAKPSQRVLLWILIVRRRFVLELFRILHIHKFETSQGLRFDLFKQLYNGAQLSGKARMRDAFLAQWTIQKPESDHGAGPLVHNFLSDAFLVEYMATVKLNTRTSLEGFHPTNVAIVVARLIASSSSITTARLDAIGMQAW